MQRRITVAAVTVSEVFELASQRFDSNIVKALRENGDTSLFLLISLNYTSYLIITNLL